MIVNWKKAAHLFNYCINGENFKNHFADLEETFSLFDIDGNGFISPSELIAVLKSLGTEHSEVDIKEMHEIADRDGTIFIHSENQ